MREGLLLGMGHILTNAPYFVLAFALFRQHCRYSDKLTAILLGGFVLAHGASDFILTAFYHGGILWQPIQFILFCIGSVALLLILFRISFSKALYAFLMIRAVYTAILYIILNAFMLARPGQYIGFSATPLYTLTAVAAIGAAFPFLWKYTIVRLSVAFTELDEKTIRRLCIPPLLFFALDQCYSAIRDTLEYDSLQTALIFILMLGTGLATYHVNLKMVMENWERARNESETEKQLALQAQHYSQLTETIEHTNAARHDLRHHLSVISAYIKRDDKPGLETYLAEYIGSIPDEALAPYCENCTVDAVARHYFTIAKDAGTEIDARLKIPQDAGLPDSDLCIIFGNIFENAAESCVRQEDGKRFIHARCEVTGGRLLFTMDNSGGGDIAKSKPKQSPGLYKGAGIGLRSVRSVVGKYNGSVEFSRENDIYKTSVILLIPNR